MNITTVLNKLKDANMISNTEDSLSLFSDCFTKFGISILLLNDESKFNRIVDTLVEYGIPLQKANGIYVLRIFAVDVYELENIISTYNSIGEIDFLKSYPEIIPQAKKVYEIASRMKDLQTRGIVYKNRSGYSLEVLLSDNLDDLSNVEVNINTYLKNYLEDPTLIDRLENLEANGGEEDFNIALELQKVENKICEEFLFPVEDGWKIVINNKEVNSFQEVKNTINTITKLNLSLSLNDALILVLFYKTSLMPADIDDIVHNVLFKEGR